MTCGDISLANQLLRFDEEVIDELDVFDSSEHAFVIRESGTYEVGARAFAVTGTGTNHALVLFKNGVPDPAESYLDINEGSGLILTGTTVARLEAGDRLQVRYGCGTGPSAAEVLAHKSGYSGFWITQLSTDT